MKNTLIYFAIIYSCTIVNAQQFFPRGILTSQNAGSSYINNLIVSDIDITNSFDVSVPIRIRHTPSIQNMTIFDARTRKKTGLIINGLRSFSNGKSANAFEFISAGSSLTRLTHRGELFTPTLVLSNEILLDSYRFNPRNPVIGIDKNTGNGININARHGVGFALAGVHRMQIKPNGNAYLLGKFESKELKITSTPTADFVFNDTYELPTLEYVENFIKEHKHLPEIAAAKEMEKNGVNIGEFQIQLLQKIEELTLHTIEQEKKIKELESKNDYLESLAKRITKLEELLKE